MNGAELARHLGVGEATVSRWRKRGCPVDNPAVAQAWVDANIITRGRRRGSRVAEARSVPLPLQEPVLADKTPCRRHSDAANGISEAPLISGTPDDLLQRMKEVELIAHEQLKASLSKQSAAATWGVKVHKDAARNVLDMEKACLRAREYQQSLVSRDWVRQTIAKHDGTMIKLVRAMPRRLGPRLAGQPIETVERELTIWVENHFLKNLHATNGD